MSCLACVLILVVALLVPYGQGVRAPTSTNAQVFRLLPVDEGTQDPTFEAFRNRFIDAVRTRDSGFVISTAVPGIRESLATMNPDVARSLKLKEHPRWSELEKVLALGGAFTTTRGAQQGRREFCAPYVYSSFPTPVNKIVEALPGHDEEPEADPWVILGQRTAVKEAPAESSRTLQYLSHNLVIPVDEKTAGAPPTLWRKIVTPDGGHGWVLGSEIRRLDDYHACFANVDGVWRLTSFTNEQSPS